MGITLLAFLDFMDGFQERLSDRFQGIPGQEAQQGQEAQCQNPLSNNGIGFPSHPRESTQKTYLAHAPFEQDEPRQEQGPSKTSDPPTQGPSFPGPVAIHGIVEEAQQGQGKKQGGPRALHQRGRNFRGAQHPRLSGRNNFYNHPRYQEIGHPKSQQGLPHDLGGRG